MLTAHLTHQTNEIKRYVKKSEMEIAKNITLTTTKHTHFYTPKQTHRLHL